jgi:lia operon protein LiaG
MRPAAVLATAALLTASAAHPLAAQQRHTLSGSDVAIYNLAGTITVTGATGGEVVAEVTARGRDAARLQTQSSRSGSGSVLRIYADSDAVLYPDLGRGSRTSLPVATDGTFFDTGGARTRSVTIAGSGRGVEAWADVAVSLPPGRTLRLYAAAGRIEVRNAEGELRIRTASASSHVQQLRGGLEVRTSSGGADIDGVQGNVSVRSSSGAVRLAGASGGSHVVETSSGAIDATSVRGESVRLTASSGRIRGSLIEATSNAALRASSGSIQIEGLRATAAEVRTSSGGIRLDDASVARLDVGASSGSVQLSADATLQSLTGRTTSGRFTAALPRSFGGNVEIRTSSGSINSALPVTTHSVSRNQLVGTIGQGDGVLSIRTNSGSVRITAR